MEGIWFCAGVALFFTLLFAWGFRVLPREEWQFLAVLPERRLSTQIWDGLNLTFYGFFNALAQLVALFFFLLLTSSAGISLAQSLVTMLLLMSVSMPASRLLARWIENKPNTATVSGGFFAGIVLAPVAIWLGSCIMGPSPAAPFAPMGAAMAIAYAFGEGTGRLGCLSFGCCYGRPLSDNPRSLDRFIRPLGLVFTGKTKKICYASGWEGRLVWPGQAVTSVLYSVTGLLGICAFLSGRYRLAMVMTIAATQIWRIISEFFRGGYRGERKFSAYQVFSVISVLFVVLAGPFLPPSGKPADLAAGFNALWNLPLILFLEGWTFFVFWHSGRSCVTGSSLSFHVKKENI